MHIKFAKKVKIDKHIKVMKSKEGNDQSRIIIEQCQKVLIYTHGRILSSAAVTNQTVAQALTKSSNKPTKISGTIHNYTKHSKPVYKKISIVSTTIYNISKVFMFTILQSCNQQQVSTSNLRHKVILRAEGFNTVCQSADKRLILCHIATSYTPATLRARRNTW